VYKGGMVEMKAIIKIQDVVDKLNVEVIVKWVQRSPKSIKNNEKGL
jgi:hypothetical protein